MYYLREVVRWVDPGPMFHHFTACLSWQPELQLTAIAGYLLNCIGIPLVIGGRLFNLAMNLLGGLALYYIALALWGRRAGLLALGGYMLLPFSVFMGRSLLPDNIVCTLIAWSMAFALHAVPVNRRWNGLLFLISLPLIGLAKLPGMLFVPLLLVVFYRHSKALGPETEPPPAPGWKQQLKSLSHPWLAWLTRPNQVLLRGLILAYLLVCAQYRFNPLNPIPDYMSLTENFRHLAATRDEMFGDRMPVVMLCRLMVAITLPGLLITIIGIVLHLMTGGQGLWIVAWVALAFINGIFHIRANTYWIFPFTAPALLLVAHLADRAFFANRRTMIVCGVFVVVGLMQCPGINKVADYLSGDSRYASMGELRGKLFRPMLYRVFPLGPHPQAYTHTFGEMVAEITPSLLASRIESGYYQQLLNGMMIMDSLEKRFYSRFPIIQHHPNSYNLYSWRQGETIGTAVAGAAQSPLGIDLAPGLKLDTIECSPTLARPGDPFDMTAVWQKTADNPTTFVVARFLLEGSRYDIPFEPVSRSTDFGAGVFLQRPTFSERSIEQVRYRLRVPEGMPAGDYRLRLRAYPDFPFKDNLAGEYTSDKPTIRIERPHDQIRCKIDGTDLKYINVAVESHIPYWGKVRNSIKISSDSLAFLDPPLVSGRYKMEVQAKAYPAGFAEEDRWPVLMVEQHDTTTSMRFSSIHYINREVTIDWHGDNDRLCLRLRNGDQFNNQVRFPMYLEEEVFGNRALTIRQIRFRPAPE